MATYAIGDVQGCYDSLMALLKKIKFDFKSDKLFLLGDIINRGPKSLKVVKFCIQNHKNVKILLGNHEIYALAMWHGVAVKKDQKYLKKLFNDKRANFYFKWLAEQKLLLKHKNHYLTHAGFLPSWSIGDAENFAEEAHIALSSKRAKEVLEYWVHHQCGIWRKNMKGIERLASIIKILTTIRFCKADNKLDFSSKNSPKANKINKNKFKAWFAYPKRKTRKEKILFGHWAALGKYKGFNAVCLDTGCGWGNRLTAYRFDDSKFFSVKARE